MNKISECKKLEELAFGDLYVDATDQTYPCIREWLSRVFHAVAIPNLLRRIVKSGQHTGLKPLHG